MRSSHGAQVLPETTTHLNPHFRFESDELGL
jgi:hypothetical protein